MKHIHTKGILAKNHTVDNKTFSITTTTTTLIQYTSEAFKPTGGSAIIKKVLSQTLQIPGNSRQLLFLTGILQR